MTWEDAVHALRAHFVSRWTTMHPSVPVAVPNGKTVSVSVDSGAFVRLRFRPSFAERIAIGGPLRQIGGRIVVNTFTPKIQGDGAALAYDSDVESIWDTAKANGLSGSIHLGAPEPIADMDDPDVSMYRSGRSIPFRIEHSP